MNQVFVCMSCSRTFFDRAATVPIGVELANVFVQEQKSEPHPKYPNDPELAKVTWVDVERPVVKIAERNAETCCATNTVLCSSSRIRFRKTPSGIVEIVGAEHLE